MLSSQDLLVAPVQVVTAWLRARCAFTKECSVNDEFSRMLDRALSGTAPSPELRPVRVASTVDEVRDRLLTAIAVGDFLPGERRPVEGQPPALLGVSRP